MHKSWCRLCSLLLPLLFVLLSGSVSLALYLGPDLEKIPIERLTSNLEELARKNPKDAKIRLNLARAHAMAYASKEENVRIPSGRAAAGVWFGEDPRLVPFSLKPTTDEKKLKVAKEHLAKAISRYEETIELDPNNPTVLLGHAWCIDQAGEKEKAIKAYREIIATAWKTEKEWDKTRWAKRSVTLEAAEYLIPLLNADADKKEIDSLKAKKRQIERLPRLVTPIVIPLRDGLAVSDLEDHAASVGFDADGSGLKKKWTWISKDAGWLVYDPHCSGNITSALQLFGSVTFWMFWDNGYQALAALDDNRDGVLKDGELQALAIWQDFNGNGISEPGEVKSLQQWDIVGISCDFESDMNHADHIPYSQRGVYFRNGSTCATYDIMLRQKSE